MRCRLRFDRRVQGRNWHHEDMSKQLVQLIVEENNLAYEDHEVRMVQVRHACVGCATFFVFHLIGCAHSHTRPGSYQRH